MNIILKPYAAPIPRPFRWTLADLWLELRITLANRACVRANADYDRLPTEYQRAVVRHAWKRLCALKERRRDAVIGHLDLRRLKKARAA